MRQKFEDILDSCIDEIKQGKSIRDCLIKYPQFASELEPLLELANEIEDLPKPQISHESLLSTLIEVGKVSTLERKEKKEYFSKRFFGLQPLMIQAIAMILIIILLGWTTLKVSATSYPGNFLYPVKIITEKVRYMLNFSPEGKVEMNITFSEERLKELVKTAQKGKSLDRKVISMMLDQAQMALNNISFLPQEKASNLLEKIDKLINYQKNTLEKIRPHVRPDQEELIDTAIEMCRLRSKWINEMCGEDKSHYRGMRCPWR